MKSFTLIILAITISAQSVVEGPKTIIPTAKIAKLTSDGQLGELKVVNENEVYLWFYISWINVINLINFQDGYLVQNYAQWIDNEETGMYGGMTCNTIY